MIQRGVMMSEKERNNENTCYMNKNGGEAFGYLTNMKTLAQQDPRVLVQWLQKQREDSEKSTQQQQAREIAAKPPLPHGKSWGCKGLRNSSCTSEVVDA